MLRQRAHFLCYRLHLFRLFMRLVRRILEISAVVAVYLGFGAGLEMFLVLWWIVLSWRKDPFARVTR